MRDRILVIDEIPLELQTLGARLEQRGFDVLSAPSAERGLELLSSVRKLHVAIVDWRLSGGGGVEFRRRARAGAATSCVHILFNTATDAKAEVAAALGSGGADDYVVKPFDLDELAARVNAGLRIVALQRGFRAERLLARRNTCRMERMSEAQAEQLVHADRLAALGMLSAGVAHEINTPTAFISGNAQHLEMFWPQLRRLIEEAEADAPDREQLLFIKDDMEGIIRGIKEGSHRISRIISALKTFARQDKPQKIPCDINDIIESALSLCANTLKYKVKVISSLRACPSETLGNAQQLGQVFINLFINAADAIGERKGSLFVTTENVNDGIRVIIADAGPGIPTGIFSKAWSPFFTTKPPGKGTGLGLSISQGIIESHGGSITVGNRRGGGARFQILLPDKPMIDPQPPLKG